MSVKWIDATLRLRRSQTRLPFRYGTACLTWCPQAILQVRAEVNGKPTTGFSGDCLPPSWFDKSPHKDYPQQIREMIESIEAAINRFDDRLSHPTSLFDAWWDIQHTAHQEDQSRGWPGLLSSFGISLVERALTDAIARAHQLSYFEVLTQNLLHVDPSRFDPNLNELQPRDWMPNSPTTSIHVRHTVGLIDPLTEYDLAAAGRVHDGLPETLEDYLRHAGVRYLKIKVCNELDRDVERLTTIAGLLTKHRGIDYRVTLDGNEQYQKPESFDALIEIIKSRTELQQLWKNTLLIEQPLPRQIALTREQTDGIRKLAAEKPVIIDESDECLESYHSAIEVGYRGVSSKSCKSPLRSILNAGLTWQLNRQLPKERRYIMTGEDLCCVGVVPVQSDLCLVAALGLNHVERNGHHYHRGLSYLPAAQQRDALQQHPDLYEQHDEMVCPALREGRFDIRSLQCVGFGFSVIPDIDEMSPPDDFPIDPTTET